jgi:hypothetical protein
MKRLSFVLLIVVLFAGATTSFADFTNTTTGTATTFSAALVSAAPNPVRIGGMAEWVQDVQLTQISAAPAVLTNATGATQTLTIQITYSSTITNKVFIFTPSVANCPAGMPVGSTLNLPVIAAASFVGIGVTIANIGCGVANTTVSWNVSGPLLNIVFTTLNNGTIILGNVGVPAVITVRGVRLNVAALGATPNLTTLTATFNAYPDVNAQITAPSPATLTVATSIVAGLGSISRLSSTTDAVLWFLKAPLNAVNTTFGACSGTDICNTAITIVPKSSIAQCNMRAIPQSGAAGGSVILTGDNAYTRSGYADFGGNNQNTNAIGIKITEAYPGILSTRAQEIAKTAAGAGATNSEADSGVRVRFDISGLPAQVVVGAAEQVDALTENANTVNRASGLKVDLVSANFCSSGSCATFNQAIVDVRAASGGTVTFEYEITANSGLGTGVASSVIIPFWLWRTSTPVDVSTVTISVRLGPVLGGSIVRFSDSAQTAQTAAVTVTVCATRLLFPFVTNMAGFDTGIYLLNGGQSESDNSGQSGACAVRFFDGSTPGTTPAKSSTLPSLGPGQSFSFTTSDPTLGRPGFQGYVIATCPFQYAYGLAYVTVGFGSAAVGSAPPGTAYLALGNTSVY